MADRRIEVQLVGDSSSLERAFRRSSRSATGFSASMKTAQARSGGFVRGAASMSGALSKFGGVLALTSGAFFAGAGIVAGIGSALTAAGEFEEAMNTLGQASGATAEQMALASKRARELGADVSLPATSATDAAEAMLQLAKGGLTMAQTLAAARGTLQLAAAAETDVGTAANTTARALTAFHLSGAQAGAIADALANGARAATGDINDFAIALSQSATSAHAFGLTAQDTVTALTELAKAGLVGSDAGTSLRVMLSRLKPQAKAAQREVKALGIAVDDGKGHFLGFRQIVLNYNHALSRLTPVQRQVALQTIFGTDAQRAANIIFGQSVDVFDNLHAAVIQQGGAAAAAAAKQKGYTGALDAFKSAIETTEVTIGTALLPTMTRWLRSAATWLGTTRNQARVQRDARIAVHDTVSVIQTFTKVIKDMLAVVRPLIGAVGGLKRALILLLAIKVATTIRSWTAELLLFEGAAAGTAGGKGVGRLAKIAQAVRGLAALGLVSLAFRFPRLAAGLSQVTKLGTVLRALASARFVVAVTVVVVGLEVLDKLAKKFNGLGIVDTLKGSPFQKGPLLNFLLGHGFESDAQRAAKKRVAEEVAIWNAAIADGIKNIRDGLERMREQNPRINVPGSPTYDPSAGGAGLATSFNRPGAKITAEQRNTFFDNAIARILLRGGLGKIREQIAAINRAEALIVKRIAATKDVTRKLNLEDQLLQLRSQAKDLQTQLGQEFLDSLSFGVTKAQATKSVADDLVALSALQAGIRKRIAAEGRTLALQQQLFDVQQQITAAILQQRQAKADARKSAQFKAIGLTAEGEERAPSVKHLLAQLAALKKAISGTTFNTPALQKRLAGIFDTLTKGGVGRDVKNAIKSILDDVDKQFGERRRRNLTKFRGVNVAAILNGLGLSPEQTRSLHKRIAGLGAGGTVPGGSSPAFAGVGADITVNTTLTLDGREIAKNTTYHQSKQQKRRASSRRGPYAGPH